MVQVECFHCKTFFKKSLSKFNEAVKCGYKQFCGKKCRYESRTTCVKKECSFCKKDLFVSFTQFQKSKNKNFFCNHSCAATFNNINRKHLNKTKNKISESLKNFYNEKKQISNCKNCEIKFFIKNNKKMFCSKLCYLSFKESLLLTKEEVLKELREFYNKFSTSPSSKMNCKLCSSAKKHFGSWNKAVIAAGLPINKKWICKKNLQCKDGHKADSISEMLIDNWLFENNILHERFKQYPVGKYTCDFYLPEKKLYVEYFGLMDNHKDYDKTIEIKRNIMIENNLNLVEITAKDLYPTISLKKEQFI